MSTARLKGYRNYENDHFHIALDTLGGEYDCSASVENLAPH